MATETLRLSTHSAECLRGNYVSGGSCQRGKWAGQEMPMYCTPGEMAVWFLPANKGICFVQCTVVVVVVVDVVFVRKD